MFWRKKAKSIVDKSPAKTGDGIQSMTTKRAESNEVLAVKKAPNRVAYFESGFLIDVFPRNKAISLYDDRDIAYNATEICSDGEMYSLSDPLSIQKIPVPCFADSQNTTFSLDYILRMCASNIRNGKEHERSILVLQKATEIMPFSNIGWSEDDYLRLPQWLYEDGRIEEGLKAEYYIKSSYKIQEKTSITAVARRHMLEIKRNSDLVAFNSYSGICCAKCAKLSGRVYSFSGNDKIFPKIPNELFNCGGFHSGCDTGFSRHYVGNPIYNRICYLGKRVDAIESTRRDDTDERTADDIQRYEQTQEKIAKQEKQYIDRKEYLILKALLPSDIPTSQYKFACKKISDPLWYSDIQQQCKEKIAHLQDTGWWSKKV